ncbi:serine/threonine-protein kinase stk11-like [Schistocerca americana]|uniref:serine/threonine-protein kinase stk11-like n=1 Tax=Schistocerca americana TaxID=7009 RepID=UPI001F4F1C9A|nr:serine/threonine-protein kinase stk11-like [Schistocerca americana]
MNGGRVLRLATWQARAYLRQLCAAVCYLQARAIVHKDIKPANLLLAPDGRLTLADFGVAEALPLFSQGDTCTRSEGSPAFQPPEVANCEPSFSGFKLDVWSCGVTLYCMLLGVHPFLEGCSSVYQLQTRIAHYQVTFPSSLEAVSEEVLRGLMARLPAERWSADRLSQHAWLVRAAPPPPLRTGIKCRGEAFCDACRRARRQLRGRVGAALALRAAVPTFDYRRGPCRSRVARPPARPTAAVLSLAALLKDKQTQAHTLWEESCDEPGRVTAHASRLLVTVGRNNVDYVAQRAGSPTCPAMPDRPDLLR